MPATKLSNTEQLDERVILEEISRGDYNAFTRLYETHVKDLTNYAFKFTGDIQIIEDSIHDIFVWFWNHRTELKITFSIKAYLFKSVRTSILRNLQRNKRLFSTDVISNNASFNYSLSGEDTYIEEENSFILNEKIAKVLGLLTSKQKEVIYLRFYQDLSFDEIASSMNLTTKACYKLMGRAIFELRKSCSEWSASIILFFLFFLYFVG